MKRYKTLIVVDNLNTGGVATSLYNYLYYLHNYLSIDLLVFNEDSIDLSKVPNDVSLVNHDKILHILGKTHKEIRQESIVLTFLRLIMIFLARYVNGVFARSLIWPIVRNVGTYELAVAYAQDDSYKSISKGCLDFVVKKVKSKYKAVMVHCDYKNFGGYAPQQIKMYNRMNAVICVSESCKVHFVECFPSLREKTWVCENFTCVDLIKEKAGDGISYSKDSIIFVSVCRLSKEKGLLRTVKAFSELYHDGLDNFNWIIVGDGPEYNAINHMVEQEGLSSKIILVGNKANPYPYIKNSSYFLLPSFNEAAPMVFGESVCLGVPILTTETCSAIEIVQNRSMGVVFNNSYEGILNGLKGIIKQPFKLDNFDSQMINYNAFRQFKFFIDSLFTDE